MPFIFEKNILWLLKKVQKIFLADYEAILLK